ncbi:MAG: neutral/alkaline non-lysosomal ceramidase N-terminal domain-containing protein [Chitinophagaceae bacterium]
MKNIRYPGLSELICQLPLVIAGCLFSLSAMSNDTRIGAAQVKITPPVGTPMAGYYYERGVDKVHDDLFAKALVIEKDGTKVAIVSCDLIGISAEIVAAVRKLVQKSIGMNPESVMISATHAHTGPVIPTFKMRYHPTGKSAEILTAYIAALPGLIAKSITEADQALQPAQIYFGLGHEESISFNRRFFMTDGTVAWNPGKLNPKIIKPAGPIDPDVVVLYSESLTGKPISTYVNFALHLDNVGGTEVSADLPFTLSEILGKFKGREMVTAFSQGCSGNINHINVKNAIPQKGHGEAQRIGTVLAGEILKTYTKLTPIQVNVISATSQIVELPLPDILPSEVPAAEKITARFGKQDAAPFFDFVKAFKTIEVFERRGKPINAEIQVFAFSDSFAVVSLPAEIFTELGMYIKSRSPFAHTMIVELANGAIGYVPDRKAFIEGSYEPWSSRVAPGSGEILVEKALEMLNAVKLKNLKLK